MSIGNTEELKKVLSDPKRLARAFTRHSYGMLAWVDLFGGKLKSIKDLKTKMIAAEIIADNARHAKLFSDRARELGETPEEYQPPEVGQRIYDILEEYSDPFDDFAYAWGSLIHFSELLDLYESVADPESRGIIEEVHNDVRRHLGYLQRYFVMNSDTHEKEHRREEVMAVADSIYRDREEAEIKLYEA